MEAAQGLQALPIQWTLAILAVFTINAIKNSKLPIFNQQAGAPNAILAALVALAAATGIQFGHSWNADAGTFTLTVTGLTANGVLNGIWAWAQQWGWQQFTWKMVKGK